MTQPLNAKENINTYLIFCQKNNISILDPKKVNTIEDSTIESKTIIFKSCEDTIIANLKWTGCICGVRCIGCELKNESFYGTNGTFVDNVLFNCADHRGVLIPLDTIKDCCVHGSHKKLTVSVNCRIIGSSICCAQSLDKLIVNTEFKLGERVMRMTPKENIFGTCWWVGLVNNVEVIGVEMIQCGNYNDDEMIKRLALFECKSNKRALFLPKDFNHDNIGICHCSKNDMFVIDPSNIKSIDNGNVITKKMKYTNNNETLVMDIKWRGTVNGVTCIGCELLQQSEYGTNGIFGCHSLFKCCLAGSGVLIPVNILVGSCANENHRSISKYRNGSINADKICCLETMQMINSWPDIKIESRIKYEDTLIGNCKWIGLVNGRESVGVKKDYLTDKLLSTIDLFTCGQNVLFTIDTIVHDMDGQKLSFLKDKLVDIAEIWKIRNDDIEDFDGMQIGDYVSTFMNDMDTQRVFHGELKWKGLINDVKCVGIDLEEDCGYGMNGVINDKYRFECEPEHGVVTTIDNVEPNTLSLPLTNDGMIDANKYLRCEKKWDKQYLEERNVSKDGCVFIIINNDDGGIWKRKGILKWSGTMNGVSVAVVELYKDYVDGTNGRFWRHQLIECEDKRVVAVLLENIYRYIPYQTTLFPIENRVFPEININYPILYYTTANNILTSFEGTVRWSGIDECDQKLYGLELTQIFKNGTDGTFKEHRLFQCPNGHGVLAPMKCVIPNTRISSENGNIKQFESTVIDSISVTSVTSINLKEWVKDTNVQFRLLESSMKYCGLVKWTGLINKIMSALVYVTKIPSNDPLRNYVCSKQFCDRIHLSYTNNLVIVSLDIGNQSEAREDDTYLKRIFGYIYNREMNGDVLMEVINNEDTRVLKYIIKEWKHPINLEHYPELLPKLIGQDNYDAISVLLKNIITSNNDNINLLNIGKYYLFIGDFCSFVLACQKCKDVNIVMDDGETFVTSVIKDRDDEDIINRVIGTNIFDINKTNKDGDSPLVLVCRKLMVSTVRLLLSNGANASFDNNMALDTVLELRKTISDMEKMKQAFEIMDILTTNIRMDSNLCKICMKLQIDTSLNCGHVFCGMCSNQMSECPHCKQNITDKRKIFMS